MRKVTQKIVSAWKRRESLTIGNTRTDGITIWLHGNAVVMRDNGRTYITSSGWMTATTKERLNGIDGVSVTQKNYVWHLNGTVWADPSAWTEVV